LKTCLTALRLPLKKRKIPAAERCAVKLGQIYGAINKKKLRSDFNFSKAFQAASVVVICWQK